ncbi:MAG TPA: SAM-dependent methyltransferase [Geobacter sp.]|nr:SAM-dependent methyltransferase [Geobacter sp.]
MEADRIKWNERYAADEYFFSLGPSKFLAQSMERVSSLVVGRRALDLACGEGRNALYLAQNGYQVTAVDIAERGLKRGEKRAAELGVSVEFVHADLETWRPEGLFDLILNFNFLLRPLIPWIVESLAPGGVVVMETILDAPGLHGEHRKDYLLQPGELERLFGGGEGKILLLEEDTTQETPVARVMFQKQ